MEDGPPGEFSAPDRLARLKLRQAAWDCLKWTNDRRIDMLVGQVWELYGGVLAQSTPDRVIFFRQLPSHYRGIEEKTWTVDASEFNMRDFSMDPSQDLLVVAERPVLE